MYINLLLGLVVLVVLWFYLRKLLTKDESEDGSNASLRESPVALLKEEVARRRDMEGAEAKAFERLRDTGVAHMREVVAALKDLRSALPSVLGDVQGRPEKVLVWDDNGDSVTVRIMGGESPDKEVSAVIGWRVPELDLREPARLEGKLSGEYFVRRSDSNTEERLVDFDNCIRVVTAFIAEFMA